VRLTLIHYLVFIHMLIFVRFVSHSYPNPDDSVPFLKFRASQLLLRQAEISSLLSILSRINEGDGPSLELLNRRRNPSNSPFDFEGWKGRLNLDDTVMAGHSFGGATTVRLTLSLLYQSSSTSLID